MGKQHEHILIGTPVLRVYSQAPTLIVAKPDPDQTETTMKKAGQFALLGILLVVAGCSKQSQVEPTAASSTPPVAQAGPAAPEAPQPAADAASQSGSLTPHPSAGQHVGDIDGSDYLISSDQNFTVGAQIVTGTGEVLFARLAVKNQTASPIVFDVKDVTIDAPGRKIVVVPRATLAIMV